MRSSSFRDLARAADAYVLQVHSLALPKAEDTKVALCDVEAARLAIHEAEKVGRPFRVALPTYQCVVLLDSQGKRVNVISEGAVPSLVDGLRAVPGTSDPQAIASLVADLKARHSRLLTGIIWHRLPVDTDRMNRSWATFQAVAAGRQPASQLEAELSPDPRGFAAVEIRNAGEKPEPLPKLLRVFWRDGAFESADGLNGYRVERSSEESVCQFRLIHPPLFDLPPGKTLVTGWVRVPSASELHISMGDR